MSVGIPVTISGMFEALVVSRIGRNEMPLSIDHPEAARLSLFNHSVAHLSEIARSRSGQLGSIVDVGARSIHHDDNVFRCQARHLRKCAKEPVDDTVPLLDSRGFGISINLTNIPARLLRFGLCQVDPHVCNYTGDSHI